VAERGDVPVVPDDDPVGGGGGGGHGVSPVVATPVGPGQGHQ
jgi:hypothetical protein